jgi:hypothetical protein
VSIPEFQIEPNWKELAARYKSERDEARKESREWKRQVAELTKKLGTATVDEIPCFTVVNL